MTEDVQRRCHWLLVVPMAVTAGLLLTACGSLSRFAVDRDVAPPAVVVVEASPLADPASLGVAAGSANAHARAVDEALTIAADAALGMEDICSHRVDGALLTEAVADADAAPGSALSADGGEAQEEGLESVGGADPAVETVASGEPVVATGDPAAQSSEPAAMAFQRPSTDPEDEDFEPYDPWAPFNERMFEFNRQLDRVVLKPVATAYDRVVPDRLQTMIANGFDNLKSIPRMVNSVLQGKFDGALREFGRLVINSTIGIGGLFDMAQQEWGIRRSEEDFGQTLGVWGLRPGPYLVLPLMEPMTIRDGIGRAVDSFLDPIGYLLPFFWERLTIRVGEAVNDRSLNLELYEGFEETVIDMYSAVRHVYLQRRERMVRE